MDSYFIVANRNQISDQVITVLKDYPTLQFMGCSIDHDWVMNAILKEKPNLIFIDMDAFSETPFDFVNEIRQYIEVSPHFIAISKTKDHAYKALKLDFIDYLLLPLSELEIRKAVLKFQKMHSCKKKKILCLKSYKDYQYLDTNEILYLKADNNTTEFHIKDNKIVHAYKTLKVFENKLPDNFLRIHKSYIVNTDYIIRINYGKQHCTIKHSGQHPIPFTKTYLNNIELIKDSLTETLVA